MSNQYSSKLSPEPINSFVPNSKDNSGNESNATLTVHVVDSTNPVYLRPDQLVNDGLMSDKLFQKVREESGDVLYLGKQFSPNDSRGVPIIKCD